MTTDKGTIVFVWDVIGPYHADRVAALAASLGGVCRVIGIELAARTDVYAWEPVEPGGRFEKITAIPGATVESLATPRRFRGLWRACRRARAGYLFLCHFERPETFLLALLLRASGRRVFVMQSSKFDDKPRSLWRELFKKILYRPYCGAIVGGARTRDYLRFMGCPERRLAEGYNTVSIERVRALAGAPPAPGGAPFADRHFTAVARFVAKKNLFLLLEAFELYRKRAGEGARRLVLCGDGPLMAELRADAARRGLDPLVSFPGFLQAEGVARVLASSLALVLPSTEEQWGLVVNEALAMGVPALVSDNVGARDTLLRTAVNGYVFKPDNAEGLARLMERLGSDEDEWRRLAEGASRFAPLGDVARFVAGVRELTGIGA